MSPRFGGLRLDIHVDTFARTPVRVATFPLVDGSLRQLPDSEPTPLPTPARLRNIAFPVLCAIPETSSLANRRRSKVGAEHLRTAMRLAVPRGLNHLPDELLQLAIEELR
jgi:hypothetical protein